MPHHKRRRLRIYAAERQAAKHKFQQGAYEDAIKIWTGCLAHGCDAATLHANLAEAFLRVGRPAEAEKACDAALAMDAPEATTKKALLRRARARLCRRDFEGCIADAKRVGKAAAALLGALRNGYRRCSCRATRRRCGPR